MLCGIVFLFTIIMCSEYYEWSLQCRPDSRLFTLKTLFIGSLEIFTSEGQSNILCIYLITYIHILSSHVVSLPLQEVANFCAAMETLIDQDDIFRDYLEICM